MHKITEEEPRAVVMWQQENERKKTPNEYLFIIEQNQINVDEHSNSTEWIDQYIKKKKNNKITDIFGIAIHCLAKHH